MNLWRAFVLGVREFRSDLTTSFVGHPDEYRMYEAYDKGRDLAHRVTLRRFDWGL
jgi:hypothetical protein